MISSCPITLPARMLQVDNDSKDAIVKLEPQEPGSALALLGEAASATDDPATPRPPVRPSQSTPRPKPSSRRSSPALPTPSASAEAASPGKPPSPAPAKSTSLGSPSETKSPAKPSPAKRPAEEFPEIPPPPEKLTEAAVDRRLRRVVERKADGTYKVPKEVVEQFKDKHKRPELFAAFEKCGYKPDCLV